MKCIHVFNSSFTGNARNCIKQAPLWNASQAMTAPCPAPPGLPSVPSMIASGVEKAGVFAPGKCTENRGPTASS